MIREGVAQQVAELEAKRVRTYMRLRTSEGYMRMKVNFGTHPRTSSVMTEFLIGDISSAYNVILGRTTLNKIGAII